MAVDWSKVLQQARANYADERKRRLEAEANVEKLQRTLFELTNASQALVDRVKPKCTDCQCERYDAYGACTNCGLHMACPHCGVRETPLQHKDKCKTLNQEETGHEQPGD